MEYTLLKDIQFTGNDYIHTWQYKEPVENEVRVYYKARERGNGFDYYAVQYVHSQSSEEVWDIESCAVECLFNGIAYYDGIRHHYLGDEQTNNYGYDYYPDFEHHIQALKCLKELEKEFCNGL